MKANIIKGVIAAAAVFAIAGAIAQVRTGSPTSGSILGVTPPPSSSATTDTSRLSSDCSTIAARQRSHQDGGVEINEMAPVHCGAHTTVIMGAQPAQPAVVESMSSAPVTPAPAAVMTQETTSTTVATVSPPAPRAPKHDRG